MRCVYIVGAGFTKALEYRRPVPLMMDFVQVLALHARSDDICLMTLIGLERMNLFRHRNAASREMARAQEPKQFRHQLISNAIARPRESIETLLNRANRMDLDLAKTAERTKRFSNAAIAAAFSDPLIRVQYAISSVFHRIGWQVKIDKLVRYLRRRCADDAAHTFVSFNYDLVLEHAIERAGLPWSADAGYGFPFAWLATADPNPNHGAPVVAHVAAATSRITVLKPHGSLNWFTPRRAEDVDTPPVLAANSEGTVRYPRTLRPHAEVRFPTLWYPIEVTPLIVPPSASKNTAMPLLRTIREHEAVAIREADEAYVLGWSMPASDKDQVALVRRAVARRRKPFKRIVVVNREAKDNYFRRVAAAFGVTARHITRYNDGLEDFLLRESRRLTTR